MHPEEQKAYETSLVILFKGVAMRYKSSKNKLVEQVIARAHEAQTRGDYVSAIGLLTALLEGKRLREGNDEAETRRPHRCTV